MCNQHKKIAAEADRKKRGGKQQNHDRKILTFHSGQCVGQQPEPVSYTHLTFCYLVQMNAQRSLAKMQMCIRDSRYICACACNISICDK